MRPARYRAITGWPDDHFVAVMNAYKDKHRDNPIMQTIAGRLAADEIAALAAYFGAVPVAICRKMTRARSNLVRSNRHIDDAGSSSEREVEFARQQDD